jgi:hypothetical protein
LPLCSLCQSSIDISLKWVEDFRVTTGGRMKALLSLFLLGFALPALAQTQPDAPQQPSYANFSIMLANPMAGGSAVVLMHNPKNGIEFVPVDNIKTAMDGGYVAVRAAELGELISALKEENARLTAENAQLKSGSVKQPDPIVSSGPSAADVLAQANARVAAADAQKADRRQQLLQNWMMLQGINRPYQLPMPVNPNANRLKTNCTSTQLGNTTNTSCN